MGVYMLTTRKYIQDTKICYYSPIAFDTEYTATAIISQKYFTFYFII